MGCGSSGLGRGAVRSGVSDAAKNLTINEQTIEDIVASRATIINEEDTADLQKC